MKTEELARKYREALQAQIQKNVEVGNIDDESKEIYEEHLRKSEKLVDLLDLDRRMDGQMIETRLAKLLCLVVEGLEMKELFGPGDEKE